MIIGQSNCFPMFIGTGTCTKKNTLKKNEFNGLSVLLRGKIRLVIYTPSMFYDLTKAFLFLIIK